MNNITPNFSTDISTLSFRDKITIFEEELKKLPDALGKNPFPLEHFFAMGLYIRKITVPACTLTVTMIHRFSHPLFLLKGELSILEEWGPRRVKAPEFFITKAGTKRIIYHHDEVVLMTVHANPDELRDIEALENVLTATSFDEIENPIEQARIIEFVKEAQA
jgi:hypothetical protein